MTFVNHLVGACCFVFSRNVYGTLNFLLPPWWAVSTLDLYAYRHSSSRLSKWLVCPVLGSIIHWQLAAEEEAAAAAAVAPHTNIEHDSKVYPRTLVNRNPARYFALFFGSGTKMIWLCKTFLFFVKHAIGRETNKPHNSSWVRGRIVVLLLLSLWTRWLAALCGLATSIDKYIYTRVVRGETLWQLFLSYWYKKRMN